MIKYLFLIIFFVPHAWSLDRIDLELNETEVHQGALVRGKLLLPPQSMNFPLQKLKGTTFGETLYFHQTSPLLRKDGSSVFESEVQVIFIKPPESENVAGTFGQSELVINTGGIKVIPVEASGKMLWAEFTAPDFLKDNWSWLLSAALLMLLASAGFWIWKKINRKRTLRLRRRVLFDEFSSCRNYDDVVSMWQKKRNYLQEFPQIEEKFRTFEEVLFKYQFKPRQSDSEKEVVMTAYRKLLSDSEGVFRGV